MCLSLLSNNESVLEPQALVVEDIKNEISNFGKRRKMSRNDSPNSSMFDVSQLAAALADEETTTSSFPAITSCSLKKTSQKANNDTTSADDSSDDAFGFYDVFDDVPSFPNLDTDEDQLVTSSGVTNTPFIEKCGSLGKRSRGLFRSQAVTSNLCALAEQN